MFQGFTAFNLRAQTEPETVTIFGLETDHDAKLPALLLLHGFPQNHQIWSRVVSLLAGRYNIVAMDLRGYGKSSKPKSISAYAKSAMARDCVAAMDALGYTDSFYVCAHDRGARVAHKLCVDYPARVQKAIFLDICPTLAMYENAGVDFAKSYFHWFFLIQKAPFPETLISANPREFAKMFMGGRQEEGLAIFDDSSFNSYVESLGDGDTMHSMCQDYRASATLDLDEARDDLNGGRLIRCPLRVLWSGRGVIERCFSAVKEWQAVSADDVIVEGRSVDSGHYIPEQVPDTVASEILDFFP
ncbi:hypothetical protein LLEC1_01408 [Akanthomyces lecanii]|uniref:AB hydrolase-1 domain-containing protein n=1 Tax=Cordyceps confragosa TaxID=2714763 RepID=A0A179ITD2_CORDF|nr:hypothetical protein LLEC1_01408 [Akanthomyces lecanii]